MPILQNQPQYQQPPLGQDQKGRREKGTGFTNLSKYLQANTGAAGQMGQGVSQNIATKAGELQKDVSKAGSEFQTQYQQQYGTTLAPGGTLGQVRQVIPNVGAPTGIGAMTGEQAEQMGKDVAGATYTGPIQYQDQQQLLNRAANLNALNQISQSQLLQGVGMRTGPYTMGETIFDVGLLSQDPAAQMAIQQQREAAAALAKETGTEASVAESQARGLKSAIESEKEDIKKDVLTSLAGMQEQAKLTAKNYLDQATRIKDILVGNIPESDINEEDRAMLGNLSNYGLGGIDLTLADEDITKQVLGAISSSAGTAYSGQSMYGKDDKNVARNLALMAGDKDAAKKIEESGVDERFLSGAAKAAEGSLATSAERTKELQQITGLTTPEDTQAAYDQFSSALANFDNRWGNSSGEARDISYNPSSIVAQIAGMATFGGLGVLGSEAFFKNNNQALVNAGIDPNSFMGQAYKLLGPETVKNVLNQVNKEEHGFLGIRKSSHQYQENRVFDKLKELMQQKFDPIAKLQARHKSKKTLQDYISERFGITPQAGQGM